MISFLEAIGSPMLFSASTIDQPGMTIGYALHGRWGEDGCIQGILECLAIPYTHSGVLASALAMHKGQAKRVLAAAGVPVAEDVIVDRDKAAAAHALSTPYVAKPVAEGSSKGVVSKSVCHSEAELREVVKEIVGKYDQPALIEEYISGREFTVGLLGERRPRALAPMEIVFLDKEDKTPVYSFQTGYLKAHYPEEFLAGLLTVAYNGANYLRAGRR